MTKYQKELVKDLRDYESTLQQKARDTAQKIQHVKTKIVNLENDRLAPRGKKGRE